MALSGSLKETSLTDLIQFYSATGETARVTITYSDGEPIGVVFIDGGDVTDAHFGDRVGLEAVHYGLLLKDGDYHVELGVKSDRRSVFEPWSQLMLAELAPHRPAPATEEPEPDPQAIASLSLAEEQEGPFVEESQMDSRPPRPPSKPSSLPPRTSNPNLPRVSNPNLPRVDPKTTPPPLARTEPPPPQAKPFPAIPVALAIAALIAIGTVWYVFGRAVPPVPVPAPPPPPVVATPAPPPPPPPAPVAAPVQGVSDTEIAFGMCAPFSGPAKELGREMKTGLDVAFAAANEAGGVNGRKLKLIAYDDGYEPERAKLGMKQLDEKNKVFGFVGNVGTPTAEVTVPYALERKMIFFGPFTGAGLLRHAPPDRYVFNYRASYAEETAETVRYLVEVRRVKPTDIAVFAQEDGFGDAGYAGVVKTLRKYKRTIEDPLRVGYKRNTLDIAAAADTILSTKHVKAVVMVATYRAAAKFIEKVKAADPKMIFTNVSFVGSAALAEELVGVDPKLADGIIVTQVVPLPQSRSTAVLRYQELLPKYSLGEKPDFVSLEGYMAGTLLIEGLKRAGRELTTEKLVDTVEAMQGVDLGVGAVMSFGMSEHQASHKVWGTMIDATGSFHEVELE